MQEYCYRSTKKDATKAFLKLLINKLRKRKLSQMRQRYLSPQSKPTGRRSSAKASNKNSDNSDDSSGFHSENSSEQGERNRSPAASADRVNHDLVHPDTVDEVTPSEETLSSGSGADKLEHTVVRQDEDGKIVSQHQKMFDSIVLHMEEHNNGIFEKLRTERKDGKEDDEDCVAMQIQLNRLKTLMDQIFCANPVAPSSSSNANSNSLKTLDRQSLSLNDPSVIISTPMVRNGCRRSLIPIESHFSPIARKQRTGEQPLPSAAMASSGQDNRPHLPPSNLPSLTVEQLQQSLALGEGEEGSGLPSLTDMSMADLTSLLMKTGKLLPPESDIAALDHLNITEQLVGNPESKGQDEDTMEALETLMLKLDRVFKGFHDPGLLRTTFDQDPLGIGNIVGDIGDQIHGFSYQFRQDHDL